jgi:hypothetical protein
LARFCIPNWAQLQLGDTNDFLGGEPDDFTGAGAKGDAARGPEIDELAPQFPESPLDADGLAD